MTSGRNNNWTAGNALSWVMGVLLGGLLGLILLIAVPRMVGGGAAKATEAASGAASTGSSSTSSGNTSEASSGTADSGKSGSSSEAAPAAGADGKEVYASNCAACHGPDAGGAVGPKLDKAAAWSMEQFASAVREGKAPDRALAPMMPHFGSDKISDAQLGALHNYLQSNFGAGTAAAAASATAATEGTASAGAGASGEQAPAATSNATEASTAGEANTAVQTPAAAPADAGAGDAAAGKEKFAGMCAGCHGANAEGGMGPKLDKPKAWSDAEFTAAVREGKAPEKTLGAVMPHFGEGQLSAADLANIHAFLKTVN